MTSSDDAHDPGRADAARDLRIIVVDDQDIVRDGLVAVLSLLDGVEVVGSGADGLEACELVERLQPDVVLMDLRMPVMDGARATARITADRPGTAVLVLTTFDDDLSIGEALRAGALGYLTKDASREDIAVALRAVARGQSAVGPGVLGRLLAGSRDRGEDPAPPTGLTPREAEVLDLIGDVLNNTEIAEQLFISTATVKTHINNLFAKLDLRDRAQAIRLARERPGRGL